MDAMTGGSAQACALCRATAEGRFVVPSRDGAHCHPETFISAVAPPSRFAHRGCVADDRQRVDS